MVEHLITTEPMDWVHTPDMYGLQRTSGLRSPDRYYWDALDNEHHQPNLASAIGYMFPCGFITPNDEFLFGSALEPFSLPKTVQAVLRYVYDIRNIPLRYRAYSAKRHPLFGAWVRMAGWDSPLFIWGWTSTGRCYSYLGAPVQFV